MPIKPEELAYQIKMDRFLIEERMKNFEKGLTEVIFVI